MGLDTVEILYSWENAFGIRISDEEAVTITTPFIAAQVIAKKVSLSNSNGPCLSVRAFSRIRSSLMDVCGVSRRSILPSSNIKNFLPRSTRKVTWDCIARASGLPLSKPLLGYSVTIADIIRGVLAKHPSVLKETETWTFAEILTVVRASVWEISGKTKFKNDDHFITDIGLD